MNKIGSLKVLNDDQENRKLVSKLPKWATDRWSRVVHQSKSEGGTFPPFSEFVKFLTREADIACDPVISSQSLREDDNKKPKDDDGCSKTKFGYQRRAFGSSFFTNKGNKTAGRTCDSERDVTTWTSAKNSRGKISHLERNTHRQMDCVLPVLNLDICQECVPRGKFVRFVRDYIQHHFTGIPKGKKEMNEAKAVTVTLVTILDS